MNKECEEGTQLRLDWHKLQSIAEADLAVIPAVAQDVETGAVVMIGYVNEEALREALSRKCAVFWSTSRNELWIKGGTSGNVLPLEEVRVNCEQNSILYRIRMPAGSGACHTADENGRARFGCYYRKIASLEHLQFTGDRGQMPATPASGKN